MGPRPEGMGRSEEHAVRASVGPVATGDSRGPGGFPLDHGHASLPSPVSSSPLAVVTTRDEESGGQREGGWL